MSDYELLVEGESPSSPSAFSPFSAFFHNKVLKHKRRLICKWTSHHQLILSSSHPLSSSHFFVVFIGVLITLLITIALAASLSGSKTPDKPHGHPTIQEDYTWYVNKHFLLSFSPIPLSLSHPSLKQGITLTSKKAHQRHISLFSSVSSISHPSQPSLIYISSHPSLKASQ